MSLGELWPQQGLVAGYHLNGNSNDFSGNGNNGTDTSITYSLANGKFNQGAGFNGSSSKILFNIQSVKTVSFWFRRNGNPSTAESILIPNSLGASGKSTIYFSVDGRIGFDIYSDGASAFKTILSDKVLSDNKFHYGVATIDVGGNVFLYVDGAQQSTTQISTPANFKIDSIGVNYNDTVFFNGSIDEVEIFNVTKDARWIRQQYALSVGKF